VETEIHRDLSTLARNNAISDALVVSAEEDLAQVIADVQDLGMRVTLVHIAVDGNWTISRALRQESDDIIEISGDHLRPYVELVAGAEPARQDEDGDLAAARADLHAAVVAERRFDRPLIALSFPPRTEPFVRLLYRVNQERAELTSTAAGVTSLRELRGYQRRLDAANEPVEDAVRVIRAQLGLPPPDTS